MGKSIEVLRDGAEPDADDDGHEMLEELIDCCAERIAVLEVNARKSDLAFGGFVAPFLGSIAKFFRYADFDLLPLHSEDKGLFNGMKGAVVSACDRSVLADLPYQEYLKTDHWKRLRSIAVKAAEIDGVAHCALCDAVSDGPNAVTMHVHHKTYERRGAELPGDLIVLCASCHAKFHGKDGVAQNG